VGGLVEGLWAEKQHEAQESAMGSNKRGTGTRVNTESETGERRGLHRPYGRLRLVSGIFKSLSKPI